LVLDHHSLSNTFGAIGFLYLELGMKIAFDIGGVLSKYPEQLREVARTFFEAGHDVFVITDMHDKAEVAETLDDNGFGFVSVSNIYCADYATHGELCKAVLLKKLDIDIFLDDFLGYVQWDSALGKAPICLLVMPNALLPYWSETWKTKANQDFGRRVATLETVLKESI
jgi:hypothetical protein